MIFDRKYFDELLEFNEINIGDLVRYINMKYDYKMSYRNFQRVLSNEIEWKLEQALIVCDVLDVPLEQLFRL